MLEADGKGFDDLLNFYEPHHRERHLDFLPHTCSLIGDYSLPTAGFEIEYFSELVQLMKYSSVLCGEFYKKWERKRVLESLLAALHHKYRKKTLANEMIRAYTKSAVTLNNLRMDDASISILEQDVQMQRISFVFNREKC